MTEKKKEPVKESILDDGIAIPEDAESHDKWVPSALEEKALNSGWRPENEWDGDPDEWIGAKEFNYRGELMARITQLGRQVGTLETDNTKLGKMVAKADEVTQKMVEDSVKRAEKNLKAQRKEAMREGDMDALDEIEENLDELRTTKQEVKQAAQADPAAPVQPDVAAMSPTQRAWYDFVTTTQWVQNPEIHNPLLKHAEEVLAANPQMGVGDFMEQVLDKGKELRGGKRAKPGNPDDAKGGTREKGGQRGRGSKYSASDLNSQQKQIAQSFVDDGIIKDLDEYASMMGKEGHLDSQRGY